jgi:hypothetical protein
MRPEKHRQLKPNESFCIEMQLSIDTKDTAALSSRINAWIEEWVRTNRYWKCQLAESEDGVLDFYDELARPPYCIMRADLLFLRIERCSGGGKLWKDWIFSRLIADLTVEFKEIQRPILLGVRDCPEDESPEAGGPSAVSQK